MMKEKIKEVKRELIIEVAKGLFFDKGYENTSIDEIAKSAGISKSTLYTYLKSKEEIFMHIHLIGMSERLDLLDEKLPAITTGLEKIRTIGSEYYYYFKENMGYFQLYMYEDYNSVDRKKIGETLYTEFTDLLDKLIKKQEQAKSSFLEFFQINQDIKI